MIENPIHFDLTAADGESADLVPQFRWQTEERRLLLIASGTVSSVRSGPRELYAKAYMVSEFMLGRKASGLTSARALDCMERRRSITNQWR